MSLLPISNGMTLRVHSMMVENRRCPRRNSGWQNLEKTKHTVLEDLHTILQVINCLKVGFLGGVQMPK